MFFKRLLFVFGVMTASFCYAETPFESVKNTTTETIEDVAQAAVTTDVLRRFRSFAGYINYAPLDLIVPSKLGVALSWIKDSNTEYEMEYLKAQVSVPALIGDIGQISEQRLSLVGRHYMGTNSFNIGFGLSYNNTSVQVGNDILSQLSPGSDVSSLDVIKIETLGLNFTLGHRWAIHKNIVFGVDWFSWSQPIYKSYVSTDILNYIQNADDSSKVSKGIDIIGMFPRWGVIKCQLGIWF